jgi:hypothetical protein
MKWPCGQKLNYECCLDPLLCSTNEDMALGSQAMAQQRLRRRGHSRFLWVCDLALLDDRLPSLTQLSRRPFPRYLKQGQADVL